MIMTLEQLHDWITRLPEPFQPVKRQTDAIEAAIRERDRLRGNVDGLRDCVERAEAELAAMKSQPFRGRAQDAIDRFAGGEELSHEEMCEVVNQAVCAERELAALKTRIAGSSVVKIANYGDPFIVLPDHFTVPNSLKGKTVRLIVEE